MSPAPPVPPSDEVRAHQEAREACTCPRCLLVRGHDLMVDHLVEHHGADRFAARLAVGMFLEQEALRMIHGRAAGG